MTEPIPHETPQQKMPPQETLSQETPAPEHTLQVGLRTQHWLYRSALAAMAALVVLCIAWEFWLAPLRPGGSWLALKVLPLLPALRGVWRKRLYTMQWASMLLLVYEAEGLVRGSSDAGLSAMLGWIEAGLSFVAYLVLVSYVRPYKNLHKQLNIYPAFKQ